MKHIIWSTTFCIVLMMATVAFGTQGHEASSGGHHSEDTHGKMSHGSGTEAGHFKHDMMVDGIHAQFEVMSLSSMNMADPEGKTHHIMVKMFKEDMENPVQEAIGKIKVIAPDGSEQEGLLKNYSGILAANFSFPIEGKYGVILLTKLEGNKHVFKFWYPHKMGKDKRDHLANLARFILRAFPPNEKPGNVFSNAPPPWSKHWQGLHSTLPAMIGFSKSATSWGKHNRLGGIGAVRLDRKSPLLKARRNPCIMHL